MQAYSLQSGEVSHATIRVRQIMAQSRMTLPMSRNSAAAHTGSHTPRDLTKVDLNCREELPYWSRRFGTAEKELREAVRKVGPAPRDVERFLCRQALHRLFQS